MKLVNAFFTSSYLVQVRSPVLRPRQRLVVWRSHSWNLKHPNDRLAALKAAIALRARLITRPFSRTGLNAFRFIFIKYLVEKLGAFDMNLQPLPAVD